MRHERTPRQACSASVQGVTSVKPPPKDSPAPLRAHRAASPQPVTERGRRTRAALIEASRKVFAERGYLEATIGDITLAADVAHGTFYTYFESKHDLFREALDSVLAEFLAEARALPSTAQDVYSRIERANRGYLRAYQRNAKLMGVLEQAAIMDPELKDIRLTARRYWVERAELNIEKWQEAGLARADINAGYAANALGAMVDRCCFLWLVLGEPFEEELAVKSLTQLYVNALGIEPKPG